MVLGRCLSEELLVLRPLEMLELNPNVLLRYPNPGFGGKDFGLGMGRWAEYITWESP